MNRAILLNLYIVLLFFFGALGTVLLLNNEIPISLVKMIPFILLLCLAEFSKVKILIHDSTESVTLSWTLVITIATLLTLGPLEAIIINFISAIITSVYPKRLPFIKIAFNVTSLVCTIVFTSAVYIWLQSFYSSSHLMITSSFFLGSLVGLMYVLINFTISCVLMKIVTNKPYGVIFTDLILPHAPQSVLLAIIGGFLGVSYEYYPFESLVFSLFLIFLLSYSLRSIANTASERIKELQTRNEKIKTLMEQSDQALEEFTQTLTATIDARDPYSYGHSMQVSNYALAIANEMEMDEEEQNLIRTAGVLHDIGKISISEAILFKKEKLTPEEYEQMKEHAKIGEQILSQIKNLHDVAKLVGMHHEHYNGRGYPRGLKYDEVSLGAYIIGVSDALEAMLSDRPYKKARDVADVMEEFKRCKGSQFHPKVVDALFQLRAKYGDASFKNSAQLIDESIIKRKITIQK